MARFKRLTGYDVMFLTGNTDEHGQKIQKVADAKGMSPQQHVDQIVEGIKELWKTMEISYDDFIRTTEPSPCKEGSEYIHENVRKGRYLQRGIRGLVLYSL